jgi:hypothetical protein
MEDAAAGKLFDFFRELIALRHVKAPMNGVTTK